jgi:hypothetical protein
VTPPKTSWAWGHGEECLIYDMEIHIGTMDPWGGNGTSCSLRAFLNDGCLTWLLPEDVRREALASAQQILGDHRPLKAEVLRGDESELNPRLRAALEERAPIDAEAERVRQAEKARLERPVAKNELPDQECFVCLRLLAQYSTGRQGFERTLADFPHAQHAPALDALDRKLAEFEPAMDRMAREGCELCRELPESSRATFVRALTPAARRIVELPALAPFGNEFRQCPLCGRLYHHLVPSYEWNEEPSGDDTKESLLRIDLESLRRVLRFRIAYGNVPEWVARAIAQAPPRRT